MPVIVPDYLHEAITKKLDEALKEVPEAEECRPHLYKQLLSYFNDTGVIPDFSIIKKQNN
jgi:hypothetical protein